MILLDPHIWLWLLHDPSRLSDAVNRLTKAEEPHDGLLISAISVWEVAVQVSVGTLTLPLPIADWYEQARTHSGTVIEPLNPLDAIASTQLPGEFHKDPADRLLIAIAQR